MPRLIRDSWAIHRLEFPFPVNYLCYASWGACVAAGDAGRLLDPAVPAAVAANLLLIVGALVLNAAADTGTDERHPERHRLAGAVWRFGRRRALRWAATELTVALVLAGAVAVGTGRPLILVAAAGAVALQTLYNAEPVRLKRRGLPGVVAFCGSVLVLPFLLSYWAVRPDIDAAAVPVVIGVGLLAIGRMTLWSVPDRAADTATGMGTPAARHGPAGAAARSLAAIIAGLALAGWGLCQAYGPGWAVPLVMLQAWLLPGAAGLLCRPDRTPSAARLRRRDHPPVTVAMVGMTVAPLVT